MAKRLIVEVPIIGRDQTGQAVASAKKNIGGLSKLVKSYYAEMAAAAAAVYGMVRSMKSLTDAYSKQQEALTKLYTSLKNTGQYTPEYFNELQKLASGLQQVTVYGDEATLSAAALLQSLAGLSQEGLKQAIPLVQDLAAGMGIDLETAASLVGKTLGSTTNALSRYGLILDATAPPSEKLAQLTEQINQKFGGMAQALGGTFQGQLTQFKNLIGDIKERLGAVLVGELSSFMTWILDFIGQEKNLRIIIKVFQGIITTVATFGGLFWNVFKTLVGQIKILASLFDNLGKIIWTVFDPRKWGKGEIKSALEDIKNTVVNTAKDIGESWVNYATKTYQRWSRLFKDDIPQITAVTNSYSVSIQQINYETENMGTVAEQTEEKIQSLRTEIEGLGNTFFMTGEYADYLIEGLKNAQKYGEIGKGILGTETTGEIKQITDAYSIYYDQIRRINAANIDYQTNTEKVLEEHEKLKEQLKDMLTTGVEYWGNFWSALGEGMAGNIENMRKMLGQLVAEAMKAIGKLMALRAIQALITGNYAKAAGLLFGSAMIYTAGGFAGARLQEGGIVTRPTLALVGEREPEAVIPLSKAKGMGITVNVYGSVMTEKDLTQTIIREAKRQGFV
ncbi:MAG: hypothetical protein ACTSPV_00790 [Candidatus Hodarchaeales archaeon]